MKIYNYLLWFLMVAAISCDPHSIAKKLLIEWQPVDHWVGGSEYFLSRLTIINQSDQPLKNEGWTIYFNSLRRILKDGEAQQDLSIQGIDIALADERQSGDLYALRPLDNFLPVGPGERRDFDIYLANWAILKSDGPAGFHISYNGKNAQAILADIKIDLKDTLQTKRQPRDLVPVPTPESRFQENVDLTELLIPDHIVPRPYAVIETGGPIRIELSDIQILYEPGLEKEAEFLNQFFKTLLGKFPRAENHRVYLKLKQNLDIDKDGKIDPESYLFYTKPDSGIVIVGADEAGVFYGIQTLRQLVPVDFYQKAAKKQYSTFIDLPQVIVSDKPRFEYRGMMLDVARHFQRKETVLKLLDLLAFFKVNYFHFHLTDDEGWRLEIPEIPELTEFGSRRGFDLKDDKMQHMMYGNGNSLGTGDNIQKPATETEANLGQKPDYNGFENALVNFVGQGTGYYTTAEFEAILRFAAERHITVIPEVEMPAHCRAATLSMEYRYRKYKKTDMEEATRFRLLDPADSSKHQTVQSYTDNFVNPGLESTFAFLETVVKSIKKRYDAVPDAKLKFIHGGGDELPGLDHNVWWQHSPVVKQNPDTRNLSDRELVSYFSTRWQRIIQSVGAEMMGWSDLFHNADTSMKLKGFIPLDWNNVWGWGNEDYGYQLANKGYKVVLSHATNLYLDLAYNKDPDEPGYYWADFVDTQKTFYYRPYYIFANGTHDQLGHPIPVETWTHREKLNPEAQKNIFGLQAQLWGENQKVPVYIEYFTFPKIIGFAERAWNVNMPPENQMDHAWRIFANSLGQSILPRLDYYQPVDHRNELPDDVGVKYRVPLPGGAIKGGVLQTNVRFPGLKVEYTKNNGRFWREGSKPAKLSPPVQLRTKTKSGRYSRVAEIME
ncbi:MAG: carbohydate-binding domain-containing protein [Candidatus Marinimicrobia bacterium]|nr:carbohydate-binding domain-containing protein [Candidatus Neomarinimicrobiota bacterium]